MTERPSGLTDEVLFAKLVRRGEVGAFAWELDPTHTRSVAQRLRRMADNPIWPVERVTDSLYPKAAKHRVATAASHEADQ